MNNQTKRTVRLILGDQLNIDHSWFVKVDPSVLYVLMEVKSESEYVTHHIQKITTIFLAMRTFADELKEMGHDVIYYKIDDEYNKQAFERNLKDLHEEYRFSTFEYQEPDEYRLDQLLKKLNGPFHKVSCSTEHFFTSRDELKSFFSGKKQYLMENFYRHMRKKHDILMDDGEPLTGKWNYDQDNRKSLPKKEAVIEPMLFSNDGSQIYRAIQSSDLPHFGNIDAEKVNWPINRKQALKLLKYFIKNLLENFGRYQDALTDRSWSLFHSRISSALNIKLIGPGEVIDQVINEWKNRTNEISIAQVEGFVRQILGWREYMRGIYWMQMPDYKTKNFFEHDRDLPSYFWSGETKMKCVSHAISQSLEHAYAHHIQRLMVTGNFCLLAGVDPDQVDEWYLGIYIDAFEWVEITNTRGMSQFADGGLLGSKPYVSSANYINKMSDYCRDCAYDHRKKTGENACPFNSLYWNFLDKHRKKLESNPRMTMMYRLWEKNQQKAEILKQADEYLKNIEEL